MIKTFQQILMMSHEGTELNLRKEIVGWSVEFGNEDYYEFLKDPKCHVGLLHSGRKFNPPVTAAHALRDGWKFHSYEKYAEKTQHDDHYPMVQIIMVRDVTEDGIPI